MSTNEPDGSAGAGNPEVGAVTGWNEGLTDYDDLVQAKGWTGPGDVLKSYVNLEKAVGADKVPLPVEGTELSEWDGWSRLGTPDEASAYDLQVPEGFQGYDQGLADWFREAAHAARMPASMAQVMHDQFVERMGTETQDRMAAGQAQHESWEAELKAEFGTAFDERVAAARSGMREFGSPELQQLLDDAGLGSNPLLVRAFSKIGMALGKGPQFKDGQDSGQFGTTPEMAKEQIAAIRGNPGLLDKTHPEHKVLNEKLTRLTELAYGTDPVSLTTVG